jgi:hypothetical protein
VKDGVKPEVAQELKTLTSAADTASLRGQCGFVIHCGHQTQKMSRLALIAACEAGCSEGLVTLAAVNPAAAIAVSAVLAAVVGAAVGAKTISVVVNVPCVAWKKNIYLK